MDIPQTLEELQKLSYEMAEASRAVNTAIEDLADAMLSKKTTFTEEILASSKATDALSAATTTLLKIKLRHALGTRVQATKCPVHGTICRGDIGGHKCE